MKKTIVTLLIAGAMLTPAMTSFAQETVDTPVLISAETEAPAYESTVVESAKAADIEKYINDETTIIGKDGKLADAVKEGDKFFVDTAKNTAVILDSSYAGSISVDVYSANGGDETGESLINSSKTLVLHVSDDTEITDLDGNKVDKSELAGKLIAVYYSVTTRSLPPQTTPEKIVVIDEAEAEAEAPANWSGVVESFENNIIKSADNSFAVNEDTVIIGKDGKAAESVAKGDNVAVDSKNNVVAVLDADYVGSIKADTFKKLENSEFDQFISSDEQLVINVSDETEITNLNGDKLTKSDIEGKKIVVYYSIMTMSLPPQAPVQKIVVLDETSNEGSDADETAAGTYAGVVESYENSVIKTADKSFTVMKNTVILNDKETIEKGDKVFINAEKNVVAVTSGDYAGFVDIDSYKKSAEGEFGEYINSNKTLALNIGEETKITDLRGNEVSKDNLDNTVLAVYHTIATMSIPAQTNPEKIVVIDAELPAATEYSFAYGDKTFTASFTEKDGSNYVPVRAVAEALGFVVGWDGQNVTVSVSENEKTTAFKVNETKLNENGATAYISNEDLTYVPVEFFSEIIPADLGANLTVDLK